MLILSQKEIENLLSPEEVISAITKAFTLFHQDLFHMPNRMHAQQGDNTLLLMPCFTKNFFGTKLVSVNPQNSKKQKPSIYGVMTLNDGETGEPLAILNGAALTSLRTGAVGALGIKHTSDENSSKLGIIGAGIQGFTQAVFACSVRPIQEIFVCDRNIDDTPKFIHKLKQVLPNIRINACHKSESLVNNSEIIICASSSQTPVIPNNPVLLEGKSFIGIGSYKPNMREFPDGLFPLLNQVWVDTPFAATESGDLCIPISNNTLSENKIKPISQLICEGKVDSSKTSFFKSVGMALFDVVVAECLYKKALKTNRGTQVQL